MSDARKQIIDEIAAQLKQPLERVTTACQSIANTTELGLVAQQVRTGRITWANGGLAVAPWVDRSALDTTSLSAILAVARAGRPALLALCVAMVLGA